MLNVRCLFLITLCRHISWNSISTNFFYYFPWPYFRFSLVLSSLHAPPVLYNPPEIGVARSQLVYKVFVRHLVSSGRSSEQTWWREEHGIISFNNISHIIHYLQINTRFSLPSLSLLPTFLKVNYETLQYHKKMKEAMVNILCLLTQLWGVFFPLYLLSADN